MRSERLQMGFIHSSRVNIGIKAITPYPRNQFFIRIHYGNSIHIEFRQKMIFFITKIF